MMEPEPSYQNGGAAAIFAGLVLVTLVVIGTLYILTASQAAPVIDIAAPTAVATTLPSP